MTRFVLYIALAVLCFAVFYTPAPVEASSHLSPHLSQDPQVNRARTLIDNGHHQTALELLRPLADTNITVGGVARTDMTDIRFLIGLSAITLAIRSKNETKTALLREAIAALRAILIDQPQLTRVRLELARAFFLNGDDDLSKAHFERVIVGKPPPAMVANIRRFLHAIRARKRWSGYFSFNVEQNDNLNSGTETEIIYLFGLPFTLNADSRPRSGNGITLATGREYQHPIGAQLRWRFGADLTHNEYRGDESDQTRLSLRTGPRWLLSQRSEASLQAIVGQQRLAHRRHNTDYGLRFNTRHQLTRQFGINGQASWKKTSPIGERRANTSDTIDTGYSLGGTYLFSPLLQGSAGIGLSHSRPQPRPPDSGSRSRSFNLGLSRILPRGWTVGSTLEWSRTRHGDTVSCALQSGNTGTIGDCVEPRPRQVDRKRVARLFLLNRGLTFFGFSPQLIVTQERQQSNSILRTYQRTRLDLRFVRQF